MLNAISLFRKPLLQQHLPIFKDADTICEKCQHSTLPCIFRKFTDLHEHRFPYQKGEHEAEQLDSLLRMTCMISSPRPHRPRASLHFGMFQVLHCLSPVVNVTSVCIGFTCWCAVLNWDVRCSRKLFSLIQYNSAWFLVFFPPLLLLPQNSFLSHPSSTFKPPGKQKPCLFKILSFQC